MNIAGIDPGFSGALCAMNEKREILEVIDMPVVKAGKTELNETKIVDFLERHAIAHCFLEQVHAMPKQGVTSMFRFGEGFGIVKGLLFGMGVPYTLVLPQRWKKAMLDGFKKEKGASIVRVKQLYPKLDLSRKKDHGQADTILIGLYGLQTLKIQHCLDGGVK